MAKRPIPLRPDEVRGILNNRKTMTRRVVKFPAGFMAESVRKVDFHSIWGPDSWVFNGTGVLNNETLKGFHKGLQCPYGQPGDVLWVREAFGEATRRAEITPTGDIIEPTYTAYRATDPEANVEKWRPSIHMPRWAARIFLEVQEVRVERLQDISEEGAKAEGFSTRVEFFDYWDSLAKHGPHVKDNPWVWPITFKRLEDYHG
ncbi:phage-like protein [Fundidesulfovibrio butyratiphilus]